MIYRNPRDREPSRPRLVYAVRHDTGNQVIEDDILYHCGSMIRIEDSEFLFTHFSAKEFR